MENGLEAGIGTGAKVQGAPASGFQAVIAEGFAQADDPRRQVVCRFMGQLLGFNLVIRNT